MHKTASSFPAILLSLGCGTLFGIGLTYSEMINPIRVLGFLDITDGWDPTLAFVMTGALIVALPGFQLARHMQHPLCNEKFSLPTKTHIDTPLLTGAALFGIGWGLAGLCPGPAIVNIGSMNSMILVFVCAMIAGMLCFHFWAEKP